MSSMRMLRIFGWGCIWIVQAKPQGRYRYLRELRRHMTPWQNYAIYMNAHITIPGQRKRGSLDLPGFPDAIRVALL